MDIAIISTGFLFYPEAPTEPKSAENRSSVLGDLLFAVKRTRTAVGGMSAWKKGYRSLGRLLWFPSQNARTHALVFALDNIVSVRRCYGRLADDALMSILRRSGRCMHVAPRTNLHQDHCSIGPATRGIPASANFENVIERSSKKFLTALKKAVQAIRLEERSCSHALVSLFY